MDIFKEFSQEHIRQIARDEHREEMIDHDVPAVSDFEVVIRTDVDSETFYITAESADDAETKAVAEYETYNGSRYARHDFSVEVVA